MTWPAVSELLPHAPPMVLLDEEVLSFTGDKACCQVSLGEGSLFLRGGRARAVVALEYMAQCVGVCTSLRSLARGERPGSGYLVGARELRFAVAHLEAGDRLVVEAILVFDGRELGSFDCAVSREGLTIASGTLNVYRHQAEERRGDGE